jgi:hypothetical protein
MFVVLTLYVNDPMGTRCRINLASAMKVKEEYPVELRVVKNGSEEYKNEENPPPCPSIKLDDRVIKEYGVMTADQITEELLHSLY